MNRGQPRGKVVPVVARVRLDEDVRLLLARALGSGVSEDVLQRAREYAKNETNNEIIGG